MTGSHDPVWLPKEVILRVHDRQIEIHGGLAGVRDEGLLESALARPLNAWSYGETDICFLAALYGKGIIGNHPFADGNKRSGLVAIELFLELNGYSLVADDDNVLATILSVAAGDMSEEELAAWLRENTER